MEKEKLKKKKPPLFHGNVPENGVLLISVFPWQLYSLPGKSNKPWQALKLIARKKVRKANYWLQFNTESRQFANGMPIKLLRENQPKIYLWALKQAGAAFPKGSQETTAEVLKRRQQPVFKP